MHQNFSTDATHPLPSFLTVHLNTDLSQHNESQTLHPQSALIPSGTSVRNISRLQEVGRYRTSYLNKGIIVFWGGGRHLQLSIGSKKLLSQTGAVWMEIRKSFTAPELISESWTAMRNMMTNLSPGWLLIHTVKRRDIY